MFVCEKCHERDRIVTKCRLGFKLHTVAVLGHCHICGKKYESHIVTIYVLSPCSICGKPSINLKWCGAYKKMGKSNGQKSTK
jgi:hypothetical protein